MKTKAGLVEILKILCLEDSLKDAEIIQELLADAGYDLRMDITATEKEFVSFLRNHKYDLILSDFKLPGFDGFTALQLAVEICPDVPFICVSGTIGEETAVELLKKGAVDFIIKDNLRRLPIAIKRALDEAKERELRQQAQGALRSSEQQMKIFLDSTSDIAYVKDDNFRHIIANHALCKYFGKTENEIIGKTDFDLMTEKAAINCRKTDEQVIRLNALQTSEEIIGERYYETLKFPVEIAKGKIGIGAYIRDITDRKHTEIALLDSEDKFKYVFDYSNIGKSITLPNGEINVNQAFCDMLGYLKEELQHKKWQVITHPGDIELTQREIDKLVSGEARKTRFNKRYIHKNGSIVWVDLSSAIRRNTLGEPLYLISSLIDITERKQTEEKLQKSEKLYHSLFENMLNGFAYCKVLFENDQAQDFVYLEVNDAFEKLTGFKDVVGRKVTDIIPGIREKDPELFEKYGQVALTGKPLTLEIYLASLGEWHAVTVYSPQKEYFISVFEVITSRKKAEERILQLNRTYAVLSMINQLIVREWDKQTLFESACKIAVDEGKFLMSWIGILDEGSGKIEPVASAGALDGYLERLHIVISDIPDGRGPTGTALREGRTVICNDIECDESMIPWRERALEIGYRSSAAFPLVVASRIVGAVNFYSETIQFFNEEEISLLEELTADISFALESMEKEEQHKLAEEALHESEEKFRRLFEDHTAVELLIDPESGEIIDANKAAASYYGWSRDGLKRMNLEQISIHTPEEIRKEMKNAISQKRTEFEFRHRLKNGSVRDVEVFVSKLEIGKKDVLHSIIHDITERRQVEEQIINERKMLRTLIDNLPDTIYVKDINCRKIIANVADVKYVGDKKEADMLGKTDLELFPGSTGERGYSDDKEVIGTGKPIIEREENFADNKGNVRWLLTSKIPLCDKDGKITGLVGIGRDITERKQAEENLLESYVFSDTLLKSIPFDMDIVDEEGTILFQSGNFKKLFGKQAIGKKCWELYRDDKTKCTDCPLARGLEVGETEAYESQGVLGNRIFEIIHTGMNYQGRKAMLEIFQDITERKNNEMELVKAKEKAEENDQLKTAFLHNISHEVRTPMNAIIGFSQLLNTPNLPAEKLRNFTGIIVQSSSQLLSVVSDIISISTIEAGQESILEKNININSKCKLLYDLFSEKAKEKNITLQFITALADDKADITTDETKIIQVLTNLIGNAIKFTRQGHVNFGYKIVVDSQNSESLIEFFIEDTGIGIVPEMFEEIFKRFRQVDSTATREFGGSGLGLSISKAYVELLGGKMWLNSEPDKGSTFYFTIPYKKVQKNILLEKSSEITIKTEIEEPKTLLVAEDEDSNFMLLEELLSGLNINIIRAKNGLEAVEFCKSSQHVDLVLMDIKMPIMNGYEAAEKIKSFMPNLPIIVQTAYTSEFDKNKALEFGCSDFISKPYKQELLISKIYEQFNKT